MSTWKPPKHGDDSKYVHIRLRSPNQFTKMRTIDIGHGCKQVYGKVKGKDKWVAQNIMIPIKDIRKKGEGISMKNKKITKKLKKMGVTISRIHHMKSGGSADYKHPVPGGSA
jgi:hypothetical protein